MAWFSDDLSTEIANINPAGHLTLLGAIISDTLLPATAATLLTIKSKAADGVAGFKFNQMTAHTSGNLAEFYSDDGTTSKAEIDFAGVYKSTGLALSGAAAGTTVNANGVSRRSVYKVTVPSTVFIAAALTQDVTIGTLPAKSRIDYVYADVTAAFASAAASSTMRLGTQVNGTELLADKDVKAFTGQLGDADAELGTILAAAGRINGGALVWASSPISLRITNVGANLGTGAVTSFTTGDVTIYIGYELL